MTGHVLEGGLGVVHDMDAPQERLHRQSTGVPGAARRGKHVVGAGAVIAQAHRRPRADENRSGGTDPGGHPGGVCGLDLQVLGGVGVDHPHPGVNVVDQDDAGLAALQRFGHPLPVDGAGQLAGQFGVGGVGQRDAVGHQHAGRHDVVLGLTDQVGGHVHRVGGVVSQDGDLGGPGLGVDADLRAADPFGRGDIDVAWPGDHVDRSQLQGIGVSAAVGEQRHRLRTTDRPDLLDPQQPGGRQDRRVRKAAEVRLRRAGHHQRVHAGGLGRHHVHHHAGRVDRRPARDVQADPLDRHPAFGDRGTRSQLGGGVGAALLGVHRAGALDGHFEGGTHLRVQCLQRGVELGHRHPNRVGANPVEAGAVFQRGHRAAFGDVVDDRPDDRDHGVDVHTAAGKGSSKLRGGHRPTAQVNAGHQGALLCLSHVARLSLMGGAIRKSISHRLGRLTDARAVAAGLSLRRCGAAA